VGGDTGPAARDAGADGTDGDLEDLGDLGVVERAEVAEHHRGAELGRQRGEGGVDIDRRGGHVGGIGAGRRLGDAVEAGGGSPRPAPELVEAGVRRHPVGPGPERCPPVEAGKAAHERDERLLRGIGGVGFVTAEASAQCRQPIVVAAKQGLQRVPVAALGGGNQEAIGPVVGAGRGDPVSVGRELRW